MINTSIEYKEKILSGRVFVIGGTITFKDSTVINLTNDNVRMNGLKISDATSEDGSFSIGSAIINKATLLLDNTTGEFDDYEFTGAIVRPQVGLVLSSTTEMLAKGEFIAEQPISTGSLITLTCLDNMSKFDVDFADVVVTYPVTALSLLQSICTHCGVTLLSSSFLKSDFVIQNKIDSENVTCREIVSYIAQLGGNFARCDNYGRLEIKWYNTDYFNGGIDGGVFYDSTPTYTSGDSVDGGDFTFSESDNYDGGTFIETYQAHHLFALQQLSVAIDDVVITGVKVKAMLEDTDEEEVFQYGIDGYVIYLENNPLIQVGQAEEIATAIGQKLVGLRFRPCDGTVLSDPCIEAGDIAYLTDRKNNVYNLFISNLTYTIGGFESFSCDAETPSEKSSTRYSTETKVLTESKRQTNTAISNYDLAVQQLTNLMSHSFGVYKTEEPQLDGSIIYYMHDKPTLAESENIWKQTSEAFAVSNDGGLTWTAGFDVDGNAVFNVLTAIGINAEWIKAGTIEGSIIAKNLTMHGGTIDITTSNDSIQYIRLNRTDGVYSSRMTTAGFGVTWTGHPTGGIYQTDHVGNAINFYKDSVLKYYWIFDSTRVGSLYAEGNVSALSFTDRTPFYEGDALSEIMRIKSDGNGNINHDTLPEFTRIKTEDGEDERDIGNTVSMLTVAVQQLGKQNREQEVLIKQLLERIEKLEMRG